MSDGKFDANSRAQAAETTLDLLDTVANSDAISQRSLAQRLGVALGLTNAVLKRCVKKGLLKVQQVPAKRYVYYLTPKGFAEKSRLTAEYLSFSLQFYRAAREEYAELFRYCQTRGWRQVILVGASDLAEIASLAQPDTGVEIVGILDPGRNEASLFDIPVYQTPEDIVAKNISGALVLTNMTDPQGVYNQLTEIISEERVLAPKLMRITRKMPTAPDSEKSR